MFEGEVGQMGEGTPSAQLKWGFEGVGLAGSVNSAARASHSEYNAVH